MKLYLRYFLLCALFYLATSGIRNLAAQELGYIDSHSWTAEFAASSRRPTWQQEIKVNQVVGDGPMDAATLEHVIKRGMWGWDERAKVRARYTGITNDDSGKTGSVTFVWIDMMGMFSMTGDFFSGGATRSWYNLDTGEIAGATVYLNTSFFAEGVTDCAIYIATHELGHAYGAFNHSSDSHDVMYASQTHCRYAVTGKDAKLIGSTPQCHIELMDDGSIYIPEIAGQGAYLKSKGNNIWHLEQLSPVDGECNTATVDSMLTVRLSQIRGYGFKYTWAELVHIGDDNWQLTGGE